MSVSTALRLVQVPGRRPVRIAAPPPVAPQTPPVPPSPSKLALGLLGAGLAVGVIAAILLWPEEPPPPPRPPRVRVEPPTEPEPPTPAPTTRPNLRRG